MIFESWLPMDSEAHRNGNCNASPRLVQNFGAEYPDVNVELSIDTALADIVTELFDVGVWLGEQVAKDMISVPIGPEIRMAVVGAPSYFASHAKPKAPHDHTKHRCINLRLATAAASTPGSSKRTAAN
jgi:DNA-binding transcriptional LysR family regulator